MASLPLKKIVITAVLLLSMTGLVSALTGSGTSSDPFQISTCSEFEQIENNLSSEFELTSDIDCSGSNPTAITGTFSGVLDGNGYTIANADIVKGNYASALFSEVDSATIANVTFDSITNTDGMSNDYSGSAIVAGRSTGSTTTMRNVVINNSKVNVTGIGNGNSGSFFGYIYSGGATIENSKLLNTDIIGGLAGGIGVAKNDFNYFDVNKTYLKDVYVRSETGEGAGLIGATGGNPSTLSNTFAENLTFRIDDTSLRPSMFITNPTADISNTYVTGEYICNDNSNDCPVFNNRAVDETNAVNDTYFALTASGTYADDVTWGNVGESFNDVYVDGSLNDYLYSKPENITNLTTSEMQGSSAETNMAGLDFTDTWITRTNDYPTFQYYYSLPEPTANFTQINPADGASFTLYAGETSGTVDFEGNITSDTGGEACIYLTGNGYDQCIYNESITSGTETTLTYSKSLSTGNYSWQLRFTGNGQTIDSGQYNNFSINEPTVTADFNLTNPPDNETYTITPTSSVDVNFAGEVNPSHNGTASINLNGQNYSWAELTNTSVTENQWNSLSHTETISENGTYTWDMEYEAGGNTVLSPEYNFTIIEEEQGVLDTSVYFGNNTPAIGATIKTKPGTTTDVTTELDIDLTDYTNDNQFRDTWNLYIDGDFEGSIENFVNGSQVVRPQRTVFDAEIGSTFTWNHKLEPVSFSGDTYQSSNYTFDVVAEEVPDTSVYDLNYSQYELVKQWDNPTSSSNDVSSSGVTNTGEAYVVGLVGRYGDSDFRKYNLTSDSKLNMVNANLGWATPVRDPKNMIGNDGKIGMAGWTGTDRTRLLVFNSSVEAESSTNTGSGGSDNVGVITAFNQEYSIVSLSEFGETAPYDYRIYKTDSNLDFVNSYSSNIDFPSGSSQIDIGLNEDYMFLVVDNNGQIELQKYELGTFTLEATKNLSEVTTVNVRTDKGVITYNSTVEVFDTANLDTVETINFSSSTSDAVITPGHDKVVVNLGGSFKVYDRATDSIEFTRNYGYNDVDISDSGQLMTVVANANSYLYHIDANLPAETLQFQNLRYGRYNYTSGGIDETSYFQASDVWQSRVDYSGGQADDCMDIYVRPKEGWNPVPAGYNTTTWSSFSKTHCVGNLEDDFIVSPIITVKDFPLNQTADYEIFAGGFINQTDPSVLTSKAETDVSTSIETFNVNLTDKQLIATLNLSRPGDNYLYSFKNASEGTIPYEFTVEGNKPDVDIRLNVYDTNDSLIPGVGETYIDVDITQRFSDTGTFGIPESLQVENGTYDVELNVTDGVSTETKSNTIYLRENVTGNKTDSPVDEVEETQYIEKIVGWIGDLGSSINSAVLSQFSTTATSVLALIVTLLMSIYSFTNYGDNAGVATFITGLMIFVVGGWMPAWVGAVLTLLSVGVLIYGFGRVMGGRT